MAIGVVGHQLSLLAPDAQIDRFLTFREDQWFERKSVRVQPRSLAETFVALANAEGGIVVVGIHDGRVEGVSRQGDVSNRLLGASLKFTEPTVTARSEFIESTGEHGGKAILKFEVESSTVMHRMTDGTTLLRVGDSNRRLRFEEQQELAFDKGQASFDAGTVGQAVYGKVPLRSDLLSEWCKALEFDGDADRLLSARGLLLPDGSLTNAAVLLFSEAPQRFFPEAYLRVLVHRGSTRGTGTTLNIEVDERFEGPLPDQIRSARDRLVELVPRVDRLSTAGRFDRVEVVPEFAWLELLVNAVIHRSYSLAGDHTRIHVFPDRFEVESPGRLPGLMRIDNLGSNLRFARNPHIARVMTELNWAREQGEGIRRIREEMKSAGLPPPVFVNDDALFSARLDTDELSIDLVSSGVSFTPEFAEALRANGSLSTGEAQELLRISRPAAIRRMRALESAGVVQLFATSKTDPNARWILRLGS